MNQIGKVMSVTEEKTVISVVRETACGESCASCSAKCSLKDAQVIAQTVEGIAVGDTVIFEMAASKVMLAAFLVYITPLIILMIAYAIASFLGASEGKAALIGIAGMLIWFVAVHFLDKRLKKYYKHTIVKKTEGDI